MERGHPRRYTPPITLETVMVNYGFGLIAFAIVTFFSTNILAAILAARFIGQDISRAHSSMQKLTLVSGLGSTLSACCGALGVLIVLMDIYNRYI